MFLFHHVRFLFQARLGRFEIASAMAPAPVATLQVRCSAMRFILHIIIICFQFKPLQSIFQSVANFGAAHVCSCLLTSTPSYPAHMRIRMHSHTHIYIHSL